MTLRREKLTVNPIGHAKGVVHLPGSKSISNRALLLAALSKGTTHLTGLLKADDTDRMIDSLRKLGIKIDRQSDDCAVVEGCAGQIPNRQADLFVGNAGTVARTLSAVLAFAEGCYRLDGVERMRERPIADLVDALRMLGACVDYELKEGYPPLIFHPAQSITDSVKVKGNVSSQFLTAILLVSPLLAKDRALTIEIEGDLISKPYVEMTVRMMAVFGVEVEKLATGFRVAPGQSYRSPGNYVVEADASGASYFLALGAMTGGPVTVLGVGKNSIQGDVGFAQFLSEMGATVEMTENSITVSRKDEQPLIGLELDCNAIPDAAMTFVPMALVTEGPIRLTGIGSWRVKETDRLTALATEMSKFGAIVEEGTDWLCIHKPGHVPATDATIETYDDHRMAMSLSLAAVAGVHVTVLDPDCTAKTFPTYFELLESLRCDD